MHGYGVTGLGNHGAGMDCADGNQGLAATDQWRASDVYKADVYDPSEHKVGKVTNLMIDSNGSVGGSRAKSIGKIV